MNAHTPTTALRRPQHDPSAPYRCIECGFGRHVEVAVCVDCGSVVGAEEVPEPRADAPYRPTIIWDFTR
jgi:hypothetical protein